MVIDTTISLVSLLSGLFGAILTAILSYFISLKVHENKNIQRRKQLAYVHFIQLTEFVAKDLILKDIMEKANKEYGNKDDQIPLSHKVLVYLSDQLKKLDKETIEQIVILSRPFIEQVSKSVDRVYLSNEQLAELPQETIYFYNRYVSKANQLKTSLSFLESTLQGHEASFHDPGILHAALLAYNEFAQSAGILRSSFVKFGGISDDYSHTALLRSYKVQMEDLNSSLAHTSKLKKAQEFVEESLKANNQMHPTTKGGA